MLLVANIINYALPYPIFEKNQFYSSIDKRYPEKTFKTKKKN